MLREGRAVGVCTIVETQGGRYRPAMVGLELASCSLVEFDSRSICKQMQAAGRHIDSGGVAVCFQRTVAGLLDRRLVSVSGTRVSRV
jgi:hypothetical protein